MTMPDQNFDEQGIELVRVDVRLPKPLVDLIEQKGARMTPQLRRNQMIEYVLARDVGWDRAAYLAEQQKGNQVPSSG